MTIIQIFNAARLAENSHDFIKHLKHNYNAQLDKNSSLFPWEQKKQKCKSCGVDSVIAIDNHCNCCGADNDILNSTELFYSKFLYDIE